MANSSVCDWICEAIEASTPLDRLESRGTVRLALKTAGLDPREITKSQMLTVVEKLLPGELAKCGADGTDTLCARLASDLHAHQFAAASTAGESPESVFARLGNL